MDMVISPTLVSFNTQPGAPAMPFVSGEVVDALVIAILADGKARLSVANTIIDVLTKVPLEPGMMVRLAVKNTSDGIQLTIIEAGKAVVAHAGDAVTAKAGTQSTSPLALADTPATLVDIAHETPAKVLASSAPLPPVASDQDAAPRGPMPAVALAATVRLAASRQNGLAPLFADAAQAVQSPALPAPVREAAERLLALRVPLAPTAAGDGAAAGNGSVSAGDVKAAFVRSGLFLEAKLAAVASKPVNAAVDGAMRAPPPEDMKAALMVFRQVLRVWFDSADSIDSAAAAKAELAPIKPAAANPLAKMGAALPLVKTDAAPLTVKPDAVLLLIKASPSLAPQAAPADDVGDARMPVAPADEAKALAASVSSKLMKPLEEMTARATSRTAALTPTPALSPNAPVMRTAPPPPYRGAPTFAQAPAAPSIDAATAPRDIANRLIAGTDAALARQTLLQAASLDHADPQAARNDPSGPRWHFEIPFFTPQGTSIAQFEIARDGRHKPAEGVKAVWRAQFSLDVEPAGPVHAQISLSGSRTAVTLWAERGETAARLRESTGQLASALNEVELEAGEVTVREGAPPRRRVESPAGRFIDRAS